MPAPTAPADTGTLYELMLEHGYTQTRLAAEIGVSQATVSRWMTGEDRPTKLGHEQRLAAKLGGKRRVSAAIERTANLADSIRNPGWFCLPSLTAISEAARRTLVPFFPRPVAHLA